MDENEVNGIAKSIAQWTSKNFSESSFERYVNKIHEPSIQAKRGSIGGKICKGRGWKPNKKSQENIKPWLDICVSRRKCFYMKLNGDV